MDTSADVLDDDMGSRDDIDNPADNDKVHRLKDMMDSECTEESAGRKEEEVILSKTLRHVLELIQAGNSNMEGNNASCEHLLSLVHCAVYDQLKNWGIDYETPTTRGRTKSRKSNSNKAARCDTGQHRPVQVALQRWKLTVKVPILIRQTCDFLREHIKTEGIFRKSGSSSRVQALMQRFSNLEATGDFTFNSCDSVFDVATALKQYLREMESPLIPYETHNIFRKCLEVPTESSRDEAVILSTCLLPEFNISILTYLIEFLMEVVDNSSENLMSFENLAIVIGPNIMPVETRKNDKAKELEHERKFIDAHTKIIEILIRNGERLACLPGELEKKIEADLGSVRGSEDELENGEGVGGSRRKKRRSGSLTSTTLGVLGFLKKVTSNKNGADTPAAGAQTPIDFSDFTHTPVIKNSKRRCLDENIFSLQKKKHILDGIRKNGLIVKEDDKRFAHLSDTPNSIAGFITCPSPVCLNPSPMMKMDWKQTPNAARFKNLVTPSLLRRKDKNGDQTSACNNKNNTPFSAPSKPVKSKLLGSKKFSKKPTTTPMSAVLADKNGDSNSRRGEVKRVSSTISIHKLAQSPRKVARASSTRIPRPDKVNPSVRKSNSSCRFPVSASPREGVRTPATIMEGNVSRLSGEYVKLSSSAHIRDEKNEAFIASKISCLEDTVDMEENTEGDNEEAKKIRLTPLIQEINNLTLTAQQEMTLSGLKRSTGKIGGVRDEQPPPPIPSRSNRRRSSGASTNKARLQSPPEAVIKSGMSAQQQRKRHSGGGRKSGSSGGRVLRSDSIRQVEDKFKRAIKETKIMRIQSERSAQVNARAVNIHRRFSVQDKGYSPSQRRIVSNAARRKSQEKSGTTTATSVVNTPIGDLSRYGFQDSISRSPNRCTLKRGRPNTLRSGLARPSPANSFRNNSTIASANTSKLNDSTKENPPVPAAPLVEFHHLSGGKEGEQYIQTPMRRMSSVQELVKRMEKGEKEPKPSNKRASVSDTSLKPINRTEPPPQKRTLSRRNSSATKFAKPIIPPETPRMSKKQRVNPNADCNTAPPVNNSHSTESWVPAADYNFESHRTRFLKGQGNHNGDRDSIQALKALNAGKVSANVKRFNELGTKKSPGRSRIPVALHRVAQAGQF